MNIWSARSWSHSELSDRFAAGQRFEPHRLAGHVYRGLSLGLGRVIERLTWIQFAKAFATGPDGVIGWNVRCVQAGPDRPWQPRTRRGRPLTFGYFAVTQAGATVELDYSGSAALGAVRDPLMSLSGESADLVLGRTELLAFGRRLVTPSYFVLERDGTVDASWSPP